MILVRLVAGSEEKGETGERLEDKIRETKSKCRGLAIGGIEHV